MLDQKTLDHLWNFRDPASSEAAFRAAMVEEMYDADERAELATQLGRAIGLQGRFEEADALLDEIDDDEPTVGVRILLERGRVLNSDGRAAMAVPLLEQAAELADHLGEEFLLSMPCTCSPSQMPPTPKCGCVAPLNMRPRPMMSEPSVG